MKTSDNRKPILSKLIIIAVFGALFLFSYHRFSLLYGLGDGYKINDYRGDDVYISKNGKIVIESTIVDYQITSDHILGLRIPARYFFCNNNSQSEIRLSDEQEFFILTKDTDTLLEFSSEDDFNDAKTSKGIVSKNTLDLENFNKIHEKYFDFFTKNDDGSKVCLEVSSEVFRGK